MSTFSFSAAKAYEAIEGMTGKTGYELVFVETYQRELDHFWEAAEGGKARRTKVRESYISEGKVGSEWAAVADDLGREQLPS